MTILFSPETYCYAAIRLDPVMMVKHLDVLALEEAKAIRPKMYLSFISLSITLPFPNNPWYTYEMCPIGPSLRVVDEAEGITSDMCVPIFPNATHPTGRPPVRAKTLFPYDNCYHWAHMQLNMRVHARPEGFDTNKAIELPSLEVIEIAAHSFEDTAEARNTCMTRQPPSVPSATEPEQVDGAVTTVAQAVETNYLEIVTASDTSSIYSRISSRSASSADKEDAVGEAIKMMNMFGNPDEDVEEWPLVHLWLDLPSVLKQDDIGSPVDLLKERDEIVDIIRRAHARNPDLPSLAEHVALHEDEWKVQYMYMRKTKRFRPRKLLRKVTTCMRKLFVIPYIPVWP